MSTNPKHAADRPVDALGRSTPIPAAPEPSEPATEAPVPPERARPAPVPRDIEPVAPDAAPQLPEWAQHNVETDPDIPVVDLDPSARNRRPLPTRRTRPARGRHAR